jgi:cytidylate kinase
VYRVFQDFLRGAFEGGLPPTNRLQSLDARRIAAVSEIAVKAAISNGPSVIVGRGSQFFLRNRQDVFHVFLYAPRDQKIRRLISRGETQDDAIKQVDTTDKARAAFVRDYLGLKWPEPQLYHAMFNTAVGESCTAAMLVDCVREFEGEAERPQRTEQRSQT